MMVKEGEVERLPLFLFGYIRMQFSRLLVCFEPSTIGFGAADNPDVPAPEARNVYRTNQ
jgi:hypothetical protein